MESKFNPEEGAVFLSAMRHLDDAQGTPMVTDKDPSGPNNQNEVRDGPHLVQLSSSLQSGAAQPKTQK
jgi:hypothetical protein